MRASEDEKGKILLLLLLLLLLTLLLLLFLLLLLLLNNPIKMSFSKIYELFMWQYCSQVYTVHILYLLENSVRDK